MEFHEALNKYGELYLFELDDFKIMFRPLPWLEYRNFIYLIQNYPNLQTDLEEMIWEIAVVEHNCPTGIDYMDAGIITTVTQLILNRSGSPLSTQESMDQITEDLYLARAKISNVEGTIKLAICEAFPSYKPEDIDRLNWSQVLERLAQAEVLLKKTFEFNSKKTEARPDSSSKVFKMLDDYSANKGPGILLPDENLSSTETN